MSTSDVSAPAVIETKLRVPSPRPEQVPRPRLLEMLEEGLDGRVTLLSAPAGYGKTILLSQWLRSREADGAFAWVSLDDQDDDPIRLWRHIVESLGRGALGEEFGTAILATLSVANAKVSGTALPMLVNALGETPQRVLLVLDDYQFATGEGCHESMDFFVEHLPENVHLVLATRSDPPLHLGRLRARGELSTLQHNYGDVSGLGARRVLVACFSPRKEQAMPRTSPYQIELTKDERNRLEASVRRYTSAYRDVTRAKIVLL